MKCAYRINKYQRLILEINVKIGFGTEILFYLHVAMFEKKKLPEEISELLFKASLKKKLWTSPHFHSEGRREGSGDGFFLFNINIVYILGYNSSL